MSSTRVGLLFVPEVREEIIDRLVLGEELEAICSEEDMPKVGTVIKWIAKNKTFPLVDQDPENDPPLLEADGVGFGDRIHAAAKVRTTLDMMTARRVVRERDEDYVETSEGRRGNPVAVARAKLIGEFTLKVAERTLQQYAPRQKLLTEDEDGNDRPLVVIPAKVPVNGGD